MSRKLSGQPLTPIERLTMRVEMTEEKIRQVRRDTRELKEAWADFAPAVADHISNKVIIPALMQGLARAIQIPASLEIKPKFGEIEAKGGKGDFT